MTSDSLPAPLVSADVDLRAAAARDGRARYFDGKACSHGHVGERYTRNATCVECQRAYTRADKLRFRRVSLGPAQ